MLVAVLLFANGFAGAGLAGLTGFAGPSFAKGFDIPYGSEQSLDCSMDVRILAEK